MRYVMWGMFFCLMGTAVEADSDVEAALSEKVILETGVHESQQLAIKIKRGLEDIRSPYRVLGCVLDLPREKVRIDELKTHHTHVLDKIAELDPEGKQFQLSSIRERYFTPLEKEMDWQLEITVTACDKRGQEV